MAPTPFGDAGLFGGGERYPLELAMALARHIDCELITFGRQPSLEREGRLRVRTRDWAPRGAPSPSRCTGSRPGPCRSRTHPRPSYEKRPEPDGRCDGMDTESAIGGDGPRVGRRRLGRRPPAPLRSFPDRLGLLRSTVERSARQDAGDLRGGGSGALRAGSGYHSARSPLRWPADSAQGGGPADRGPPLGGTPAGRRIGWA